jgi:DNA helicase-2/ATP-dependent DNA helicase PcrA
VQTLHEYGREHNVSLYTAAKVYLEHDMIKGPARRGLAEFLEHLDVWNNLVATHTPPDLTRVILEQSGYRAMWENDRSAESTGRLENLRELVNALSEFPSLVEFFEHVSLVMDHITAATADMVTIMTLHGAKGLEFDVVFLAGWEEGLLPNARALLDRNGLEEERRLAYVGLTRAKEAALISYARNRRLFNQNHSPQPSRFIAEIPEAHVEFLNQYHQPISISAPQRSWSDTPTSWGSPAKGRPGKTDWDQDIASPPSPDDMTQEQARVRHKLFGYGTIIGREGDKLTIQFDNGEQRKIMQHFIEKVVAF